MKKIFLILTTCFIFGCATTQPPVQFDDIKYEGDMACVYGVSPTMIVGDYQMACVGHRGKAGSGNGGISVAGDWGIAYSGMGGKAYAGSAGVAEVGDGGEAFVGLGGIAMAGDGGYISILWFDGYVYRKLVGQVGVTGGLEPNKLYKVTNFGRFEEVKE